MCQSQQCVDMLGSKEKLMVYDNQQDSLSCGRCSCDDISNTFVLLCCEVSCMYLSSDQLDWNRIGPHLLYLLSFLGPLSRRKAKLAKRG